MEGCDRRRERVVDLVLPRPRKVHVDEHDIGHAVQLVEQGIDLRPPNGTVVTEVHDDDSTEAPGVAVGPRDLDAVAELAADVGIDVAAGTELRLQRRSGTHHHRITDGEHRDRGRYRRGRRDRRSKRVLWAQGWHCCTIWECDVERAVGRMVGKIAVLRGT